MKRVSGVRQCQQHIYVQKISHGKSSIAVRTSSLVTFVSGGDLVILKPVFASVINFGRPVTGFAGVKMIESPLTSHVSFAPGRNCKRARALLGKTTCPLLDNVAVMAYRLTRASVSQAGNPIRLTRRREDAKERQVAQASSLQGRRAEVRCQRSEIAGLTSDL